jgi:hypothetical protein
MPCKVRRGGNEKVAGLAKYFPESFHPFRVQSYLLKKAGKRPEGLSFDHIFRGNLRDGVHHPRNIEKIRSIHKKIHANG